MYHLNKINFYHHDAVLLSYVILHRIHQIFIFERELFLFRFFFFKDRNNEIAFVPTLYCITCQWTLPN